MDFKLLIRRFFAFVIDWNIMFGVAVALMFYCPGSNPEYLLYPSIKMLTSAGFLLGLIWVPGAPRQRNAPGDADGNATCTRAAEDVGPYHTPMPAMAHSAVRVSTLPRTTTPRAASAASTLGSTFTPGAHR